jgi:hypothetical protein
MCGKNEEFMNVQAGGAYSYHCFKGLIFFYKVKKIGFIV